MAVELNEQQQRALDDFHEGPPRLIDPRTATAYVLIPVAEYETVQEVLEDERRQRVIRSVGLRNAVGRMGEGP